MKILSHISLLLLLFAFYNTLYSQGEKSEHIKLLEGNLPSLEGNDKIYSLYQLSQLYLSSSAPKAIEYSEKALKLCKKEDVPDTILILLYGIYGKALEKDKEYKKAIKALEKEYELLEGTNDEEAKMKSLFSIGALLRKTGRHRKAIDYNKQSLEIASKIGSSYTQNNYLELYENYYAIKDLENALLYYKSFMGQEFGKKIQNITNEYTEEQEKIEGELVAKSKQLNNKSKELKKRTQALQEKDSELQNKDSVLSMRDMQLFYARLDSSLKAAEIKELTMEKELQDERARSLNLSLEKEQARKRSLMIIIGIILFSLILLLFLFIQIKKKNKLLTRQKEEIQRQNAELQQKNEEIEAQRDEIERQRDIVTKQNQHIKESIQYASYIQNAVLPPHEEFDNVLKEHFVLYIPKDIVSGDFYWLSKVGNKIVIAAADCTGHGVPGAFMSMLGVSLLNEIVHKDKNLSPAQILNELRKGVKKSLRQTGKIGESKDGMDIALCVIDETSKQLSCAGAYNPVYIVKKAKNQNEEPELLKIKANRMPIGVYNKEDSFTEKTEQLSPGDTVYIFSDGFVDQFGGENNEKFKAKRFQRLLIANVDKPLNKQYEIINSTLTNWRGMNEQIDDILVMGFRV